MDIVNEVVVNHVKKPSTRVSNKGKPHRPRVASEPGEIYLINNKINKKKYVGQVNSLTPKGKPYGTKERWNGHKQDARNLLKKEAAAQLILDKAVDTETVASPLFKDKRGCRALSHAINKHGAENFECEIILKCGADMLDHHESIFIDAYNTLAKNKRGYNLKSGGNGNGRADGVTRQLMSDKRKGDLHPMFGKHHSNACKAKIAAKLQNVTRMDFDGCTPLPHGIKAINDAGNVGYALLRHVLLPQNTKIQFTVNRHLAQEDAELVPTLCAKCVYYLQYLDCCVSNDTTPTTKKEIVQAFLKRVPIAEST